MRKVALGLRENARQFWLLVLINGFVGAMIGLERELLPLLGEQEFGVTSKTALLSFIASFGAAKAIANYSAGRLGDSFGRKQVLVAGWIVAIPVAPLIIWAPSWSWIVFANVLLGAHQGLAWSSTIVMKIDLVGPKQRGLAMGLNEFAGWLAVGIAALAAGLIAERFGLRPVPFYLGIGFVAAGLSLTVLLVRDTTAHVALEAASHPAPAHSNAGVFAAATWRDPALSSCSQAGLVNNLNDGVVWGLLPLLLAGAQLSRSHSALLVAIYPTVWGATQLITGLMSDRYGRRTLIVAGMTIQAIALSIIASVASFWSWLAASALLGIGTAMVYPTLLAAVSDAAHPAWRSSAVGVYRFWRDSGYVAGALFAGVFAQLYGIRPALHAVAVITLLSGALVALRMPQTQEGGIRATSNNPESGAHRVRHQG